MQRSRHSANLTSGIGHGCRIDGSRCSPDRDLRLDLFRGLALWLIFLDHIPSNIVAWVTLRNYGFSDATEIFIFISGYTAAFVYGRAMRDQGFVVASARILKRAWQIYVAHIFLFTIYLAEIAYVARGFQNPLYAEEMGVLDFLQQPDVTIFQALLLKFKPVNMDVLPLYIVLLTLFPPILWLLLRNATLALAVSVALYAATWEYSWNLPAYPTGHWYFNPFAWQLLFVFGAWCALGGAERLTGLLRSRITLVIAIAYLLFAFFITLTWHFPRLTPLVPKWLAEHIYPIDKTNLDVLRFAHFLALAAVTVYFIPRDWPYLTSDWLRPAILCGQHSLEIFCLGVFLAFAAHFAKVEISPGIPMQIVVSVLGILIMIAVAWLLTWYKSATARRPASVRPSRGPTSQEARHETAGSSDRIGHAGGGRCPGAGETVCACSRARAGSRAGAANCAARKRSLRGAELSRVHRGLARSREQGGQGGPSRWMCWWSEPARRCCRAPTAPARHSRPGWKRLCARLCPSPRSMSCRAPNRARPQARWWRPSKSWRPNTSPLW